MKSNKITIATTKIVVTPVKWRYFSSRLLQIREELLKSIATNHRISMAIMLVDPVRIKKEQLLMKTKINTTKIVLIIHLEERVMYSKATRHLREGRIIIKWMKMDTGQRYNRVPISIRKIIENIMTLKCKITCKFPNKILIRIQMELFINKHIVQWLLTMKWFQTTNISWNKIRANIQDNLQVMLRSKVVVVHFNLIVLCNMLQEKTLIYKQRWLNLVTIILEISIKMDTLEEDQQMLMIEIEKINSITKIKT